MQPQHIVARMQSDLQDNIRLLLTFCSNLTATQVLMHYVQLGHIHEV